MSYSSKRARRFGGTLRQLAVQPASAGFMLVLLFDPEVAGDIFSRNVGLSPNYTALQPRRP
jgi:hypothetical protein